MLVMEMTVIDGFQSRLIDYSFAMPQHMIMEAKAPYISYHSWLVKFQRIKINLIVLFQLVMNVNNG